MNAEAILTVSSAVLALTEFVKWAGLPKERSPFAVMVLSALGVVLWGWSHGGMTRESAFDYFAGGVAVMVAAAGAYGFIREAPDMLAQMRKPKGDE